MSLLEIFVEQTSGAVKRKNAACVGVWPKCREAILNPHISFPFHLSPICYWFIHSISSFLLQLLSPSSSIYFVTFLYFDRLKLIKNRQMWKKEWKKSRLGRSCLNPIEVINCLPLPPLSMYNVAPLPVCTTLISYLIWKTRSHLAKTNSSILTLSAVKR